MQTSESIKPENTRVSEGFKQQFGRLLQYRLQGSRLVLFSETAEIECNRIEPHTLRITVCTTPGQLPESTVAVRTVSDAVMDQENQDVSPFMQTPQIEGNEIANADRNAQSEASIVSEDEQFLVLLWDTLQLRIKKDTCQISIQTKDGQNVMRQCQLFRTKDGFGVSIEGTPQTRFYGLGEKAGSLDKRNDAYTMWNTDIYEPHVPEMEALYVSVPFVVPFEAGRAVGLFLDNPGLSRFDFRSSFPNYEISAETGGFDFYVFLGPTIKEVVRQYTHLTGRMPLPPQWAIGYHQSRYSYESQSEVLSVAKTFKDKNIPLDALYLDIHYMNGYRVFTFDSHRFPDPKLMTEKLLEQGVHLVPIVDPGVKRDADYAVYRSGIEADIFCKSVEGDVFFGDVWPGESAFPDFTDTSAAKWWAKQHDFYVELGITGIWNDMNEPAVFNEIKTMAPDILHRNNGVPRTHREVHNLYGLLMSKITYQGLREKLHGERPFVLTRAGYAGVQRYAAVWTGDNRSFWEHMQMAMPMVLNMGISGIAFGGPDVGGFAHHTTGELLARWTQMGAFFPFFRNHSALDTVRQEPWSFGPDIEKIITKYIQLRYQFLPYLYSVFRESSLTGLPVMRPLVLEYPDDEVTYNLADEFLLGPDVLVAPVYRPDETCRAVYLPQGTWVNYWTGERVDGSRHILVDAPLDTLPLFIRGGAVVPMKIDGTLTLHAYAGERSEPFVFYEDDGKTFAYERGDYCHRDIQISMIEGNVRVKATVMHNGFDDAATELQVCVHRTDGSTVTAPVSQLNFDVTVPDC